MTFTVIVPNTNSPFYVYYVVDPQYILFWLVSNENCMPLGNEVIPSIELSNSVT